MAKRIIKSDKKVKAGKAVVKKGQKELVEKKNAAAGNTKKQHTSPGNKSVKATGKALQASPVVDKGTTKDALKALSKKPFTNGKAKTKKPFSKDVSNSINAKPAKKSSTSIAPSRNSITKAGLNNSSSTSNKSSQRDPFSEKLNTVTPSGYKDQTFFEQVFDVARQIPKGRVTSYGAIAASLGARSSSRMVGWAMNLAGSAKPKVPAHRVVNRNGMLSGKHHFATPTQMQELLEKEGVVVKDDKVVNFSKLFWDPMDL